MENQVEALRRLSKLRNQSIAELVRISVALYLDNEPEKDRGSKVSRAKALSGMFSSGSNNGSSEHDKHLAAAFGE